MTITQLTLDGREVPYDQVVHPLSLSDLLAWAVVLDHGGASPSQVGTELVGPDLPLPVRYRAGLSALRRLARRGLVRHRKRAWWVPNTSEEDTW